MKTTSAAIAFLSLLPGLAHARSIEEKELLSATGQAIAQTVNNNLPAARAVCEAARKKLPAKAEPFLSAYTEECYALTAAPYGPGMKPESCRHWERAIDIWKETPPPEDDDEAMLGRARKLKSWKKSYFDNCPDEAGKPRKAGTPKKIPAIDGPLVETQEGLSYELPKGWRVDRFSDSGGAASAKGPDGYTMQVERTGFGDPGDFPDTETLPGGRTLKYRYAEFLPKTGYFVLYGRMEFPEAGISIGMSRDKSQVKSGVEKSRGLDWLRSVAASVKITGPRKCLTDCPPGKVKPRKKARRAD